MENSVAQKKNEEAVCVCVCVCVLVTQSSLTLRPHGL